MNNKYYHKSKYDLYIDNSSIPNSGLGVFTKEFIPKNSYIDNYYGQELEYNNGSDYLFEITSDYYIDAKEYPRCYMAMLNDASYKPKSKRGLKKFIDHKYINNCTFLVNEEKKEIYIFSLIDIYPNTELFISYGSNYWSF